MKFYVLLFSFATITLASATKQIPDYIHICKRSDPQLARCIRESIAILRPKLANGIPELNVPGLEPLHIDEIEIINGGGSGNIKAVLKNIDVTKASSFQITKLKVDLPKGIIRFALKIPVLNLDGDYDINVRVLVAPIKGQGRFHAIASDIEAQILLKSEIVEKENRRFMQFTSLDTLVKLGDYNIQLDNLFNGDKILSQAAIEVLNGNKEEFINAATPFIQRKVSELGLNLANSVVQDLDYDELWPEK